MREIVLKLTESGICHVQGIMHCFFEYTLEIKNGLVMTQQVQDTINSSGCFNERQAI